MLKWTEKALVRTLASNLRLLFREPITIETRDNYLNNNQVPRILLTMKSGQKFVLTVESYDQVKPVQEYYVAHE